MIHHTRYDDMMKMKTRFPFPLHWWDPTGEFVFAVSFWSNWKEIRFFLEREIREFSHSFPAFYRNPLFLYNPSWGSFSYVSHDKRSAAPLVPCLLQSLIATSYKIGAAVAAADMRPFQCTHLKYSLNFAREQSCVERKTYMKPCDNLNTVWSLDLILNWVSTCTGAISSNDNIFNRKIAFWPTEWTPMEGHLSGFDWLVIEPSSPDLWGFLGDFQIQSSGSISSVVWLLSVFIASRRLFH